MIARTLPLSLAIAALASCGRSGDRSPPPRPGSAVASGSAAPLARTIDCRALVTAAEVAAACEAAADITSVAPTDGAEPGLACALTATINRRIALEIAVDTRPASAAAARALLPEPGTGVREVAVGDAGRLEISMGMAWENHAVLAAKGATSLAVKTPVSEKSGALCSDDAVIHLATVIAGRLP